MADRAQLRATFDEDAVLYDRARPTYPRELFDELASLTGIGPGSRVLEVGCGTGQATVPLADRGCEIVAVELGASLAAAARRNLARFPSVAVVVAAFEEWPLPPEPFDLVIAATAWHWVDETVRVPKAAAALRPGGALAIISTHHVAGGDEPFFAEVQDCYERWDPATPPGLRLPPAAEVRVDSGELEAAGAFEPPTVRRWTWEQQYTTAEYLDVLRTYSGHRALDPAARAGLLACVADLIDTRYGGSITKRYLNVLLAARRRDV